jgi:F0F1-type ATP synthase assembly protein I
MAIAANWASQIIGLAFEVILPVVLGRWLDQRWGTSVWTIVGAVLGPMLGFWHLLALTGVVGRSRKQANDNDDRRS